MTETEISQLSTTPEVIKALSAYIDLAKVECERGICEGKIIIHNLPQRLNFKNIQATQIAAICQNLKQAYISGVFSQDNNDEYFRMCISYTFSFEENDDGSTTLTIKFLPTHKTATVMMRIKKSFIENNQMSCLAGVGEKGFIKDYYDHGYKIIKGRQLDESEIDEQMYVYVGECYRRIERLIEQANRKKIEKLLTLTRTISSIPLIQPQAAITA